MKCESTLREFGSLSKSRNKKRTSVVTEVGKLPNISAKAAAKFQLSAENPLKLPNSGSKEPMAIIYSHAIIALCIFSLQLSMTVVEEVSRFKGCRGQKSP
jgi:hypothetical protein